MLKIFQMYSHIKINISIDNSLSSELIFLETYLIIYVV